MSSAREEILANIRRGLAVTGQEAPRKLEVSTRLSQKPRGLVPQRGAGDQAEQALMFTRQAQNVSAVVHELESLSQAPAEIARVLAQHGLPQALRLGADARLSELDWAQSEIALSFGPSQGEDQAALSHAFAGIAETGTLALVSGADNPTTLNFLPDVHIGLLALPDLVGDLESVWDRLRQSYREAHMPRTLNLITGPSRSADIEQTLLLGAHGPRHLHILLYPH